MSWFCLTLITVVPICPMFVSWVTHHTLTPTPTSTVVLIKVIMNWYFLFYCHHFIVLISFISRGGEDLYHEGFLDIFFLYIWQHSLLMYRSIGTCLTFMARFDLVFCSLPLFYAPRKRFCVFFILTSWDCPFKIELEVRNLSKNSWPKKRWKCQISVILTTLFLAYFKV